MRSLLEVGKSVKFNAAARKFYLEEAYNFNVICGEIMHEVNAKGYLFYNLLGRGYPYKAKVIQRLDTNVFKIEVTFKCGFVGHTNSGAENFL